MEVSVNKARQQVMSEVLRHLSQPAWIQYIVQIIIRSNYT